MSKVSMRDGASMVFLLILLSMLLPPVISLTSYFQARTRHRGRIADPGPVLLRMMQARNAGTMDPASFETIDLPGGGQVRVCSESRNRSEVQILELEIRPGVPRYRILHGRSDLRTAAERLRHSVESERADPASFHGSAPIEALRASTGILDSLDPRDRAQVISAGTATTGGRGRI